MIKKTIIFLLILTLAIYAGSIISRDPGYVLMAYDQTTIEMPLWLGIFLLLFFLLFSFAIFSFFRGVIHIPQKMHHYFEARQTLRHWQFVQRMMMNLAAKNWEGFKNSFQKGELFSKNLPNSTLLPSLLKASMCIAQSQYDEALMLLENPSEEMPKDPAILNMLVEIYMQQKKWEDLAALFPRVEKWAGLNDCQKKDVKIKMYTALLQKPIRDVVNLKKQWQLIPRADKKNALILATYISQLIQCDAHDLAEEITRDAVKKNYDALFVNLYGAIRSSYPEQQIKVAEKWLKKHSNDAVLLKTLGRLCLVQKLWGKAKFYLEQSINMKPDRTTYLMLIRLLERLNQSSVAAQYYKKAFLTFNEGNHDI